MYLVIFLCTIIAFFPGHIMQFYTSYHHIKHAVVIIRLLKIKNNRRTEQHHITVNIYTTTLREIVSAACDFICIWGVSTSRWPYPDHLLKFALTNLPCGSPPNEPHKSRFTDVFGSRCVKYQQMWGAIFAKTAYCVSVMCTSGCSTGLVPCARQHKNSEEQYQQRSQNNLPPQQRQASGSMRLFLCTLYSRNMQHQST